MQDVCAYDFSLAFHAALINEMQMMHEKCHSLFCLIPDMKLEVLRLAL